MHFYDFPIIRSEGGLPIFLVSVGLHECQPYMNRREGYPYPQIFYCTRGSGTLLFSGAEYKIKPHTAFFMPANFPHEYFPDGDIWDIHWIVPSGFAVSETLSRFGLVEPAVFELEDIKKLEHIFRKIHEALIGDKIFGNYRAAGYLYDFLIEFYRLTSTVSGTGTVNPAVIKAVDYINSNYTEQIALKDLCEASGVSGQHLCRLFRAALNSRPMEYVAKRRIQAAKELLSDTDKTVDEIAEETGFCTGSYFCKLFRRYEGMTPSQFRRG